MNKTVSPKQLELVDDKPPIATPACPVKDKNIAVAEATKALLGMNDDEFDWNKDDSVILREQRATAVYHNRNGDLIIRQQGTWDSDGDTFLFVTPENCDALCDGIAARIRSGS